MHQLVQTAIEAAKNGDKNRAQGYLKQVLTENPNDVDGWLVLAAVLEDAEKKRQCLNRVLTIDPANQIAREELLTMDRAVIMDRPAPLPQPAIEPLQFGQQPVQAPIGQTPPAKAPSTAQPGARLSKTLVFTYPLWLKVLTYIAAALFWLFTIATLCASPTAALILGGLALLSLGSLWVVSARVEVSNENIQSSHLLIGRAKIAWNEITEFKSNATGQNLNLIASDGRKVSITAQVGGYAQIIEILRRKRPDLFNVQPASRGGVTSQITAFSGEKSFKRGAVGLIVGYTIGVLCLLFGIWGAINYQGNTSNLGIGLFFIFFGLYLLGANLLSIQEIIVKPQQITIVKNFGEEELTHNQVAEIKIKTVRGRRGRVTNFVIIQRVSGGSISINGLEGGPELLYDTLMNWWQGAN
jgi:hypothetical protein